MRKEKLFIGLGGLVVVIAAVLLIFTFVGMPGGDKLFGLTVNGYQIEPGADLRDANLANANLKNVDVTGADLSDADLTYANLTGANLTDANLNGAIFWDTTLPDGTVRSEKHKGNFHEFPFRET